MEKLLHLGFMLSADFARSESEQLGVRFLSNESAKNILYAIIFHHETSDESEWQVRYIGHAGARSSFGKRMKDYRRGAGEATNNRIHEAINDHLCNGGRVSAYCMPDHFNMSTHDLHIDLAAGIEMSLIRYYARYNRDVGHLALLNIDGNDLPASIPGTSPSAQIEAQPIESDKSNYFLYRLGKTYWNYPSINVPKEFDDFFGPHGSLASADLVVQGKVVGSLQTEINRTANLNGTPRLYFSGEAGTELQNWKREHFNEGDEIEIVVVGCDHVRLSA